MLYILKQSKRCTGRGKPEYMHPVSNLYKLYKFVPANSKWFFIQSVKKGFFVIRTKELSYKIE